MIAKQGEKTTTRNLCIYNGNEEEGLEEKEENNR